MNKVIAYIRESYQELVSKVSWPKYSELQSSSILVLVASLIFAIVIGIIDLAFENAMRWFYNEF